MYPFSGEPSVLFANDSAEPGVVYSALSARNSIGRKQKVPAQVIELRCAHAENPISINRAVLLARENAHFTLRDRYLEQFSFQWPLFYTLWKIDYIIEPQLISFSVVRLLLLRA